MCGASYANNKVVGDGVAKGAPPVVCVQVREEVE
jgi:hypothetical protein